MAENVVLILIIAGLAVCSLWLVGVNALVKGLTSFRLAILAVILIFVLTVAPAYFYFKIPSQHSHIDINNITIWGIISFKAIIIALIALWVYLITALIFHLVYKITFETSAFMAILFYLPFILCILLLLVSWHYNSQYFNQLAEIILDRFDLSYIR
ncbi:hypothetical protein [Orbus mooreae]|uniref:hypothetical protein n=1 Tax=Orbus mooreae TaxID=3074107 RepID=UPI00370D3700